MVLLYKKPKHEFSEIPRDIRNWKYDIDSYERLKKIVSRYNESGISSSSFKEYALKKIDEIEEKYPFLKKEISE